MMPSLICFEWLLSSGGIKGCELPSLVDCSMSDHSTVKLHVLSSAATQHIHVAL